MFISADTMAYLLGLGLDPSQLTELVRRLDDDAKSIQPIMPQKVVDCVAERKRAADRERMREKREAENVARQSRDVARDNSDNSLSLPLSPQTPQTPTHTHGDINTHARKADRDPEGFASFWEAYPRRVGKDEARKAFAKAIKRGAVLGELIGAVERDKARQWAGRDTEMIPHPSTWLNQGRWQDEPPPNVTPLRKSDERSHANPQLDRSSSNLERALAGAEVASRLRTVQSPGGF